MENNDKNASIFIYILLTFPLKTSATTSQIALRQKFIMTEKCVQNMTLIFYRDI